MHAFSYGHRTLRITVELRLFIHLSSTAMYIKFDCAYTQPTHAANPLLLSESRLVHRNFTVNTLTNALLSAIERAKPRERFCALQSHDRA